VPIIAEPRTYRHFDDDARFKVFRVVVETSDLYVKALSMLERETEQLVRVCRDQIKQAINRRAAFLKSLEPVEAHPDDAPVVLKMIGAGRKAGTGPMAAVAGAVAEFVGQGLLPLSSEVIVENGGDIFLKVSSPVVVGILAPNTPFANKLALSFEAMAVPLGICTSSGNVGPSLSLGRADAATIVSKDVALADAVATALGNRIHDVRDAKRAVQWAMTVPGVEGALAVKGDTIAALGNLELVPLDE
jgi:ApbE superfamily uncharacterized protein (UPF0280 family)